MDRSASPSSEVFHKDLTVGSDGRRYWRTLDELEQSPEFIERLHREFPNLASEWMEDIDDEAKGTAGLSRRGFLTVMGASLAMMGLTGCRTRTPTQKIVPYVNQPEQLVLGKPLFYATCLTVNGAGHGVLVESHEGRPTKIEGNPQHPATLGATNVFLQASILQLYDPDRSQVVTNAGVVSTWDNFLTALNARLDEQLKVGGSGLRILSEPILSPTLAAQAEALRQRFPQARWHFCSPTHRVNKAAGARQAFGQPLNTVYALNAARVIFAVDSDFLVDEPGSIRYARHFIDGRRVRPAAGQTQMNRLYSIESTRTITGAVADHRLPLPPEQIALVVTAVARALGVAGLPENPPLAPGVPQPFIRALADDLQSAGKNGLVICGEYQPPAVHAICHAINARLGAIDTSVYFTDPITSGNTDDPANSIQQLVSDMNAGQVDTLLILGGNPVYNAPVELDFAAALNKVPLRARLGLYEDETSFLCHWHIPQVHELEQWSDTRAFDGTVSIAQPLIAPLYGGRSAHDLLAILLGESTRGSYEVVRGYWQKRYKGQTFELSWETALHDGVLEGTGYPAKQVGAANLANVADAITPPTTAPSGGGNAGLRIVFRPDPTIGDGAWANNAWLQELHKPMVKFSWDNAVLLSPATAKAFGVENEQVVDLRYRGREVQGAPICIMPGQPDNVATVYLGYGRSRAGSVGSNRGFDVYRLRTADAPWFGAPLEIVARNEKYPLAFMQHEQLMHGRDIVRTRDVADLSSAKPASEHRRTPLNLYTEWDYSKGNAWGMVIDQTACIGCNACVIGCQSENNIPVVGKEQTARGRWMQWLRIDTYYASDAEEGAEQATANPETYFQPVPCMHCEKAPCELVCPVGATVHDSEGTNNMVYNRCVGTRYCSNNCPYKVRRFNYLEFSHWTYPEMPEQLKLLRNPDVTVRSRGVMEKCTYCIQRINAARIESKKNPGDVPAGFVKDGEVLTACQQACPTDAIIFGNLNDPNSRAKKLKAEPTNYGLLEELNTQPRTTYLERIRNPNPAIKSV